MPEDKKESKRGKILGYVLIAIGLIAVIIIVWQLFFRNPCKKGEKQDPDSGLCVSACPPGTSFDESSELCVEGDNGDGDDGVIPSPLGTPDFHKSFSDFPREVQWIFRDDGWNPAYELELITGTIRLRAEAWFMAPDRIDIHYLDQNDNWIWIGGDDYWGGHKDMTYVVESILGRATIKGFKFKMRYGYFTRFDLSTL